MASGGDRGVRPELDAGAGGAIAGPRAVVDYTEYAPSAEYLHLLSRPMWTSLSGRLAAVLADADPAGGVVVEFGAGTGLGTDVLLDTVPGAPVLAAEPSPQLRAVLLARLSARPDAGRVTVFPVGAAELPLPDRITAAVGMHMIGHVVPDQRRALFAALMPRLTPGAPVVFNVQPPETAVEVPESEPFGVAVGRLRYEGRGRAEPVGPDRLRWTMTYRTLDGDRELASAVTNYDWWTVSATTLAAELRTAGASTVDVDGDLVVARAAG